MTVKTLEKQALQLKAIDKIHLIEMLMKSLDRPDPAIEKMWIKESDERIAAYERGELKVVPAATMFKNIKRKSR